MAKLVSFCVAAACLLNVASADMYMMMPRGSNNRLNEQSAERTNGNRLFDSQNNARGGYNVGDKTDDAFNANAPEYSDPDMNFDPALTDDKQYQMGFFEGSKLLVEWTNQHGCGGNEADDSHKTNCDVIIQYMCDIDAENDDGEPDRAMSVRLRNGGNTNTPEEPNSYSDTDPDSNNDADTGRHESKAFYYECKKRERNQGLFTADQKLKGSSAKYTRQNPNGNRRGLECPEERDYYPYWNPSPWVDIAILTDKPERCAELQSLSQNVATVYKCEGLIENDEDTYITEQECIDNGGEWKAWTKGLTAPDCQQADWSRVNHHGNGRDGQMNHYEWELPTFSGDLAGVEVYGSDFPSARCAFRVRYNISTDDYDITTNATYNNDYSVIEDNPEVDVGMTNYQGLQLALNTDQTGRTFQDRSHTFYIMQRPAGWQNSEIVNLNVRGKRGNIVQTYPAVEYDFVPNDLEVATDTLVHVQWTGSNTHNNGKPGGDGQTGDDGEGTTGTDRSNMAPVRNIGENFPIPLDVTELNDFNMFRHSTCYTPDGNALGSDWVDCAVAVVTSGYAWDKSVSAATLEDFSVTLDNSPASLVGGVLMQFDQGVWNYICTRNNNFSNRSQKGRITVRSAGSASVLKGR